ncbi:hypothetical protein [Rhizobium leguminosarum]|nr:hypothetical protein [Rhizobium leguminosarum]
MPDNAGAVALGRESIQGTRTPAYQQAEVATVVLMEKFAGGQLREEID